MGEFSIKIFTLVILILTIGSAQGSEGFKEDFSSPVLDSNWTVLSSLSPNTYSLSDNPGHLRYNLAPWINDWTSWPIYDYAYDSGYYYPSLAIVRNFMGKDWNLKMKVSYDFSKVSNGRRTDLFVVLNHNDVQILDYIRIWRSDDMYPGDQDGYVQVDFVTHDGISVTWNKILPTGKDTWYFEVTRKGQVIHDFRLF